MEILAVFLYILLFICLAGFSSGYETGLLSIPMSKVEERKALNRKFDKWILRKMENLEQLISVTLVSTNLFLTCAVIIFLVNVMKFLKGGEAELLTVLLLTPLSILFAEILPKSLFRAKPELIFKTAKFFQILYVLIYPLTCAFYRCPSKLITSLTHTPSKDKALYTKEQIKVAISKGEERGVLEDYERSILHKVFDVGEKQVKEIMIPFKKVTYLDKGLTIREAKEEFKKYKFSRMPIYDQETEKFIGLVSFMDFMIGEVPSHENITKIMHPIIYVDDNTYLDELLIRMLKEKAHLIGIKNSIGMTVGIVTLEDVLEEIVGEY